MRQTYIANIKYCGLNFYISFRELTTFEVRQLCSSLKCFMRQIGNNYDYFNAISEATEAYGFLYYFYCFPVKYHIHYTVQCPLCWHDGYKHDSVVRLP